MIIEGKYIFDKSFILEKAYDLLCIFFANKEISRRSNIDDQISLAKLEERYFEAKASRLLIEIAASIRVNDDQMKNLPESSNERQLYYSLITEVDSYNFDMFHDPFTFREICNKIIHSKTFKPHTSPGSEGHETDYAYRMGDDEKSIEWDHFNGFITLSGTIRKENWHVLLDIEVFVRAIYKVFA